MSIFSPTFWIAIAIWSAICASSGAVMMEKYKNGEIAAERLEVAQIEADRAKNAAATGLDAQNKVNQLGAQLAKTRRERDAAIAAAKGSVHGLITPATDAHVIVPTGFVWLWNAPLSSGASGPVSGPTVAGAITGSPDSPSGVALSAVGERVIDAKGALEACRTQVKGWQDHWSIVTQWYQRFLDGLK